MNALALIEHQAEGPQRSGRLLFTGDSCQYADVVRPGDLIAADFDDREVRPSGGLYLLEAVERGRVTWRGCRRMMRAPDGIAVDQSGRGNWVTVTSLEAIGLRIAAKVENVYRSTH